MKITLVHPAIGRIPGERYLRAWQMEPLPLAHVAGLTDKEHTLSFFDDRIEVIDYERSTDLAAISIETYTAKRAYQIASQFRQRGVPVAMGGFHASLMLDEVAEYADYVIVGEAEHLWPTLLRDISSGNSSHIYKASERPSLMRTTPDRSIFNGKRYLPVTLVETARGCTFKCEFCAIQSVFKSTQTRKDTESVLEEIRRTKQGSNLYFFVDDNVVSHPDEFKEFLRQLIPLSIRWVGQATITMTHDAELLDLMKRSGCQGVLIGFESLDSNNLKTMNKSFNATRGGPALAIQKLHAAGIRLYATFMFGYEFDSEETFKKTLQFCLDHKIFMVAFNHLTPFPGTPLYTRLQNEGRLLYDTWWLDDTYRYGDVPFETALPRETIRRLCQSARRDFYSYKSILLRMFNRTNSSGGLSGLWMYLFINMLLHQDTESRYRYPLGDPAFTGPLLKKRTENCRKHAHDISK
jgi:radical SAM superfamily enzyme YgiQ (UPF0313 family)